MAERDEKPTDAELEILQVLWNRGPCTVRQVHENIGYARSTVYTTVLKLLQIMNGKGWVVRDESERSHVYSAAVTREDICDRLMDSVVQSLFDGSKKILVEKALTRVPPTPEDLQEMRQLFETERERKSQK